MACFLKDSDTAQRIIHFGVSQTEIYVRSVRSLDWLPLLPPKFPVAFKWPKINGQKFRYWWLPLLSSAKMTELNPAPVSIRTNSYPILYNLGIISNCTDFLIVFWLISGNKVKYSNSLRHIVMKNVAYF